MSDGLMSEGGGCTLKFNASWTPREQRDASDSITFPQLGWPAVTRKVGHDFVSNLKSEMQFLNSSVVRIYITSELYGHALFDGLLCFL